MKNRYDNLLRDYNSQILELTPANQTLRVVLACEFIRHYKKGMRTLEIGVGEGDSAEPILARARVHMDLLDVSGEMLQICKDRLTNYGSKLSYICSDALEFLQTCKPYDIITSSWTIHNFPWPEKRKLFSEIYNALAPGGIFIYMDKLYVDGVERRQYKEQIHRYLYLPKKAAEAILQHEKEDFSPKYRMTEERTISELKRCGFKRIKIIDRITRDVVLVAYK